MRVVPLRIPRLQAYAQQDGEPMDLPWNFKELQIL
jgi:hypothetical protein